MKRKGRRKKSRTTKNERERSIKWRKKRRDPSKMENEKELLRRLRVKARAGGWGEMSEREVHEEKKGVNFVKNSPAS